MLPSQCDKAAIRKKKKVQNMDMFLRDKLIVNRHSNNTPLSRPASLIGLDPCAFAVFPNQDPECHPCRKTPRLSRISEPLKLAVKSFAHIMHVHKACLSGSFCGRLMSSESAVDSQEPTDSTP